MRLSRATLTQNWHLMRIVRLGIGLYLVGLAAYTRDWMPCLLGAFFLYQALADVGCCGSGACAVPQKKLAQKQINDDHQK